MQQRRRSDCYDILHKMRTETVKDYYHLTKPGIVYSNTIAAIATFLMASAWDFKLQSLFGLATGTALIIASSCVINNYIDRGIDARMTRTKSRALVSGKIPVMNALLFAAVLGVVGFSLLFAFTNWQTALVGAIGVVSYLVLYGWAKRITTWGTLIGSISGSMPFVSGYVAVTSMFDIGALLLFMIMASWQMAHFYAIGMYRAEDYRSAGLPILPVMKGYRRTQLSILGYISLFIIFVSLLSSLEYVGVIVLIVLLPVTVRWLNNGLTTSAASPAQWGRTMFANSLGVLLLLCGMLSVGSIIP